MSLTAVPDWNNICTHEYVAAMAALALAPMALCAIGYVLVPKLG